MKTKNYNVIPLSIDKGLDGVQVGTAGGYIRLLEAPATAEVFIHLNDKQADGIPLKVYHAIEATDIERIFVTCNAIPGETIKIVQANTAEDFKMVTPASDVKLSALGSYESVALDQLDKIINPYTLSSSITATGNYTSLTTILSKTLSSNIAKIRVILLAPTEQNINGNIIGSTSLLIDGNLIATAGSAYNTGGGSTCVELEFFNVAGKTISSQEIGYGTTYYGSITLEEYTLKP